MACITNEYKETVTINFEYGKEDSIIKIATYSEKSIAVRGTDTKTIKEELKAAGCKWNPNLKDGAGWIAPTKNLEKIKKCLEDSKYLLL
jgi:hypothetical protein